MKPRVRDIDAARATFRAQVDALRLAPRERPRWAAVARALSDLCLLLEQRRRPRRRVA
jgi:hypothetical protein